jgi:hypothetical protein
MNELAVMNVFDMQESKTVQVRCSTKSKHATAFCALGAVQHVNGPAQRSATAFLREAAAVITGSGEPRMNEDIFIVNDEMGHPYVLKMFKLAIKRAVAADK